MFLSDHIKFSQIIDMNKIKRQMTSNHPYNTRSKKLRITMENAQKK